MSPAATFQVSRTFYRGYELCYGSGLPSHGGHDNAIIPGIVCLAFSIELGLKSLLQAVGDSAHRHNLKDFFDRLSDVEKEEVICEAGIEDGSFHENLALIADAFIKWRYIYEQPGFHSISEPFMSTLSQAVRAVAKPKIRVFMLNRPP